ncbi:TPA: hypothetical protein SIA39_004124 [Aeromonas sobria]|nr:hypothetical protein [Aeromonas sobria]
MAEHKTYFGLEVHTEAFGPCVHLEDVQRLPFYAFWLEAAKGSTLGVNHDGLQCVYLQDWEKFAIQFINTGTHRNQSTLRGQRPRPQAKPTA